MKSEIYRFFQKKTLHTSSSTSRCMGCTTYMYNIFRETIAIRLFRPPCPKIEKSNFVRKIIIIMHRDRSGPGSIVAHPPTRSPSALVLRRMAVSPPLQNFMSSHLYGGPTSAGTRPPCSGPPPPCLPPGGPPRCWPRVPLFSKILPPPHRR